MTQRFDDTLFQPTQWYPRVAKYDDLRGWDMSPYLGPSEFYNNFGRFDVRIDVPAGWIVSGTGLLQNPQEVLTSKARERLTHVLESDAVTTIVGPEEASVDAGDRIEIEVPALGRERSLRTAVRPARGEAVLVGEARKVEQAVRIGAGLEPRADELGHLVGEAAADQDHDSTSDA
jgi:hypothetical protein